MKVIDKLSTYASLVGVIGAIGGGFYAWGEFNTRLGVLENKEYVVNETVDLSSVNEKISNLEVNLIDRIEEVNSKIVTVDLSTVKNNITSINETIKILETHIFDLGKEVAVVAKENELQSLQIEEIKVSSENPLSN
jgi:hypothetical protein